MAAPSESSLRTYALIVVALGVLGVVGWMLLRDPTRAQSAATQASPTTAPTLIPTTVSSFPTGRGYATLNPKDAASAEKAAESGETPCGARCFCASTDPCASGRTCAPGGCSDEMGKGKWRLRLGGLAMAEQPPNGLDGDTKVCVRVTGQGEPVCTTLKQTRGPKCTDAPRLQVTTELLLEPGLDIDIFDGAGHAIASARGAAYKFMTDRELCLGLRFGKTKFTGKQSVDRIWFFLDDA